jgi:hypothetical protein
MLSLLEEGKRLRGQFEGQNRPLHSTQIHVELRQEFLKSWGFTVFEGSRMVFNCYSDIAMNRINLGYGAGLRYKHDKKEHVKIRLDVGGGPVLPYFTISEVF